MKRNQDGAKGRGRTCGNRLREQGTEATETAGGNELGTFAGPRVPHLSDRIGGGGLPRPAGTCQEEGVPLHSVSPEGSSGAGGGPVNRQRPIVLRTVRREGSVTCAGVARGLRRDNRGDEGGSSTKRSVGRDGCGGRRREERRQRNENTEEVREAGQKIGAV